MLELYLKHVHKISLCWHHELKLGNGAETNVFVKLCQLI
jgi:hypothetical protein